MAAVSSTEMSRRRSTAATSRPHSVSYSLASDVRSARAGSIVRQAAVSHRTCDPAAIVASSPLSRQGA